MPERTLYILPGIPEGFFMLPVHVACAWAESLLRTGEKALAEPFLNVLRASESRFGKLNYDEHRVLAMA